RIGFRLCERSYCAFVQLETKEWTRILPHPVFGFSDLSLAFLPNLSDESSADQSHPAANAREDSVSPVKVEHGRRTLRPNRLQLQEFQGRWPFQELLQPASRNQNVSNCCWHGVNFSVTRAYVLRSKQLTQS